MSRMWTTVVKRKYEKENNGNMFTSKNKLSFVVSQDYGRVMSGTMPLGNLISPGAILFSGTNPGKALNLFRHAGNRTISERTYL